MYPVALAPGMKYCYTAAGLRGTSDAGFPGTSGVMTLLSDQILLLREFAKMPQDPTGVM